MTKSRWFILIAVLGYLLLYILPLGGRHLILPDETRYVEIPREMLSTGDFIVPRLNGLRYFEKPVLAYWCQALSLSLLGETRFAARLPFAMAVGVTAMLVFLLVRRTYGDRRAAALSAIAYLLCFEVFALGIVMVLDALFALWVTGALIAFFLAYQAEGRKRAGFLALMGVLCGIAFLTKGILAFALVAVAIGPFLLWERRPALLLRMPWIPLLMATLVILPWALAIHVRESDYWHYFFWVEHLNRFAGEKPQHEEPFWYYFPVIFAGALPWTPLFPAAILGLRKTLIKDPLPRLCICWFLFCTTLFCLSRGKLATYLMPCFPPLAILTVMGLKTYFEGTGRKALVLGSLFCAGVAAVACVIIWRQPFDEDFFVLTGTFAWRQGALVAAIALCSILSVVAIRARTFSNFFAIYCIGPALILLAVHAVPRGLVHRSKMPVPALLSQADVIKRTDIIISDVYLAPAICWVYKRDDVRIIGTESGELTYGLNQPDAVWRSVDETVFRELIKAKPETQSVFVVAKPNRYERVSQWMPEPKEKVVSLGLVFARF